MHQIEIPDIGKTFSLPDSWEECTPQQIEFILPMAFRVLSGEMDIHEFSVRIFCKLTGLRKGPRSNFLKKIRPAQVQDSYAMVSQLADQLCGWPFQPVESPMDDEGRLELALNTHVNILPVIHAGRKELIGPADLIADLTFAEFRIAIREMDQHIAYAKHQDLQADSIAALDRFVAVLYRPLDPSTGKKQRFNSETIQKLSPITAKIPSWKKNTILLWFSYCINYIQSEDVLIDGNNINLSVLFPKSTGRTGTEKKGIGWAGLLFDVSKEGPFGTVEKTDQIGLFDILLYLYKNHHDNMKLQKRLKSKK